MSTHKRSQVVHKKLWIAQVIHALTVTGILVIHALTVTHLRINGDAPIYNLYLPVINTPVVRAAPNGDNPAGYRPSGLHLLPTTL